MSFCAAKSAQAQYAFAFSEKENIQIIIPGKNEKNWCTKQITMNIMPQNKEGERILERHNNILRTLASITQEKCNIVEKIHIKAYSFERELNYEMKLSKETDWEPDWVMLPASIRRSSTFQNEYNALYKKTFYEKLAYLHNSEKIEIPQTLKADYRLHPRKREGGFVVHIKEANAQELKTNIQQFTIKDPTHQIIDPGWYIVSGTLENAETFTINRATACYKEKCEDAQNPLYLIQYRYQTNWEPLY